jgi:hypothetical protein
MEPYTEEANAAPTSDAKRTAREVVDEAAIRITIALRRFRQSAERFARKGW